MTMAQIQSAPAETRHAPAPAHVVWSWPKQRKSMFWHALLPVQASRLHGSVDDELTDPSVHTSTPSSHVKVSVVVSSSSVAPVASIRSPLHVLLPPPHATATRAAAATWLAFTTISAHVYAALPRGVTSLPVPLL